MKTLSQIDLSTISFYWKILQFIPTNVKLGLAAKLTTSVLEEDTEEETTVPSNYTKKMMDKFFGAWVGNETADEVMTTIKSSFKSRKPISLDIYE